MHDRKRLIEPSLRSSRTSPLAEGPNRRELLRHLGVGLGAGLLPGCSLGPEVCGGPPPDAPPASMRDAEARALLAHIDTFVVVMLENRSFDHLLGGLRFDRAYPGAAKIEGLTGGESNLDRAGREVMVGRMPGDGRGNFNPKHDWRSVAATFNQGRNDRFVAINHGPHQHEVMTYLGRDQVPVFHALADRGTVFDQWFASYLGQTWPNRFYLHATTSGGRRDNRPFGLDAPLTIWERMAERCASGRNYAAGPVLWHPVAFPGRVFAGESALVPGKIEDFFRDARAGNLPNFSLIDPDWEATAGYPTHDLSLCQAFISSIVKAVASGPQWSRSLLLITFDEHGGYYDHVPPGRTVDVRPDFRQLGFRVPALAIGPTVRQGAVVSTPLEHVSVAATLRARFGIATLSPRMDAARDFADCIDPALITAPAPPPTDLPVVELPRAALGRVGGHGSQPELEAALAEKRIPEALVDPRSGEERFGSWLRLAQEIEAVKIRG